MPLIIDFHTHTFPDDLAPRAIAKIREGSEEINNHTDGTVTGLLHSMHTSSITHAVPLPIATKPEQVAIINQQQIGMNRESFIPFGTIHPDAPDREDTVAFLQENGIKGIKLHPEYQDFFIDDVKYFPLYDALSSAGMVVLFHAGKDLSPFSGDHALPSGFKRVRRNLPYLKIVAAHMGGWKIWQQVLDELAGTDIYFDTAAVYGLLDKELFMKIAAKHGMENIVFGSDSPWFDQGSATAWIDSLPLLPSAKEKIFATNAQHLLSL